MKTDFSLRYYHIVTEMQDLYITHCRPSIIKVTEPGNIRYTGFEMRWTNQEAKELYELLGTLLTNELRKQREQNHVAYQIRMKRHQQMRREEMDNYE